MIYLARMTSIIYTKAYKEPPVDKREALRYAGVRGEDPMSEALVSECLRDILDALSYRVCYREIGVDEPFAHHILSSSQSLARAMAGVSSIIVFAATVGSAPDAFVRRASISSPARAVMYQAIGAERIEALCDACCEDMQCSYADRGFVLTGRFSPGYGDLSLDIQRDIFGLLDCPRQIGLALSESLIMIPTKSVSAIIGIKDKD